MESEYQIIHFPRITRSFLSRFTPENDLYISNTERNQISIALGLNNKSSKELTIICNNVIDYYANKIEQETSIVKTNKEKKEIIKKYQAAANTISKVIEDIKINKFGKI